MYKKTNNFLRVTALIAVVFLGVSCASKEDSVIIDTPAARLATEAFFGDDVWITRPRNSSITVIGIAGRRFNMDDAIAEALSDAARRVSLYHGLYGQAASVINQGSGLLDYYIDADYNLTLFSSPESHIDSLVFNKETDVLEKNGAVYVRTSFSGVAEVPPYVSTVKNGIPSWASNFKADIPGYYVGIGCSKNKGSPQKTYQASYELAVVSLLSQISSRVEDRVIEDSDGNRETESVIISEGRLSNIMILETWFDQSIGAVWTLVVAKAN